MDFRYLLHQILRLIQETFSTNNFSGKLIFACLGLFFIFSSFRYFRKHNFVFFVVFLCGLFVACFGFIPSNAFTYVISPLAFLLPLIMIYGYPKPAEKD